MEDVYFLSWQVRVEAACNGLFLEELQYDSNWMVRIEVAKKGYNLIHFKDDKEWKVRLEVAKQGHFLNQFKDDLVWVVRREVAKQGHFLELLKSDQSFEVRIEVAKQGYALEELKNDLDRDVREIAIYQLKKEEEKLKRLKELQNMFTDAKKLLESLKNMDECNILIYEALNKRKLDLIDSLQYSINKSSYTLDRLNNLYGDKYHCEKKIIETGLKNSVTELQSIILKMQVFKPIYDKSLENNELIKKIKSDNLKEIASLKTTTSKEIEDLNSQIRSKDNLINRYQYKENDLNTKNKNLEEEIEKLNKELMNLKNSQIVSIIEEEVSKPDSNQKVKKIWLSDLLKERKLTRSTPKLEKEMLDNGYQRMATDNFPRKVFFIKYK
jgi:hypothetical protein